MRRLAVLILLFAGCDDGAGIGGGGPIPPSPPLPVDLGVLPDGCAPSDEVCDGVDNDCDGTADELLGGDACEAAGVGACGMGIERCTAGVVSCEAPAPDAERCNALDDDCDGVTDETAAETGQPCEGAEGCGAGLTACVDGEVQCAGDGQGVGETCNGADDDCDGTTDEDIPATACGASEGRCAVGTNACVAGEIVCEGAIEPTPETCDGVDEDCDGTTDEAVLGLGEACDAGAGCGAGTVTCEVGALRCAGDGGSEEVCDGTDNDCDGIVDELDPDAGAPCGSDVGACEFGRLRCIAGQETCLGGTSPVEEACDTIDNDCDGATDEAAPGGGDCGDPGDACGGNDDCDTALCLNDFGNRYCSQRCPEGGCPEGFICDVRLGSPVCRRPFETCTSTEDCDPSLSCQLVPPAADDSLGGECRPRFAGGSAMGAECERSSGCAGGFCLGGVEECSGLCRTAAACGDGFECVLTPFQLANASILDLGLCITACGGDGDCDVGRICRYSLRADRGDMVGHCDEPFDGAPTGAVCDLGADPPLRCDHGFCQRDPAGRFCTQGCEDVTDCPDGWACVQRPLVGTDVEFGLCARP